jgi:hypothetical protein
LRRNTFAAQESFQGNFVGLMNYNQSSSTYAALSSHEILELVVDPFSRHLQGAPPNQTT